MEDLGILPGGTFSSGKGINEHGEVTGEADVGGEDSHAFLYRKGRMIDLGVLPGLKSSVGLAISRSRQIVGVASTRGDFNSYRAFIYNDGKMQDLNSLLQTNPGWILSVASGINDKGEITGFGLFHGKGRAFVLLPVHPSNSDGDRDESGEGIQELQR